MLLTADKIHDGYRFLPDGYLLEVLDDGSIAQVRPKQEGEHPQYYKGIVCPGFVNAHCHLELSHMHGVIPKHIGLPSFLKAVMQQRNSFAEISIIEAMHMAYENLYMEGTVAVGDIANTTQSIAVREKDKMHVHTFVEALGFVNGLAEKAWQKAKIVFEQYATQQVTRHRLSQSITPHAPYSVSQSLFQYINQQQAADAILSIHNQECLAENEFYLKKEGAMIHFLASVGIPTDEFHPPGKSSLLSYASWLDATHPLILVHNTFTSRKDVVGVKQQFPQLYFCLCPNANLYIEDCLPDIAMLMEEEVNICIGTDSLASNDQLSVWAELQTLRQHSVTDWEKLLHWATLGGARALQLADQIGSFTLGKKPGIVQIPDIDSHKVNRIW